MLQQRVEDATRAWQDAFNRADLDALMALYEPGATFVPQPGQVAVGAAAIREALAGFLALDGRMEIEPTIVEAEGVALVAVSWTLAGTGPDGAPVTMNGRATDVVRRQPDGAWRWAIDVPFGIC